MLMFTGMVATLAIMTGDLAVKILGPVVALAASGFVCIRYCRAGAWLRPEENTLVIRNTIGTHRIPLNLITTVRRIDSGVRVQLADGQLITATVLAPKVGFGKQQAQGEAIAVITQAAEAARAAHPETAAVIQASAPQRARRDTQRMVLWLATGPVFFAASFVVPRTNGFDVQLRWIGAGLTMVMVVTVLTMLSRRSKQRPGR
jgi:hypothetical protein